VITSVIIAALVYVAFLLGVGAYAYTKAKTLSDYLIAGRTLGPWILAFTYCTSWFSAGSLVGAAALPYKFGLAMLWGITFAVILMLLVPFIGWGGRVRVMTEKLKALTVPDFLGKRYQSIGVRQLCAIVVIVFAGTYLISILAAMGTVFEGVAEVPYSTGVIIFAACVIAYVALGGFKGLALANFFQGCVMLAGIVAIPIIGLSKIGGYTQLVTRLGEINPKFVEMPGIPGWPFFFGFLIMAASVATWGNPHFMVQFFTMKDKRVVRWALPIAIIFSAIMGGSSWLGGAIGRVLLTDLSRPDLVIPTLVHQYLPFVLVVLWVFAMLAASMTSAGTFLLVVGSAFSRDIFQGLLKKDASERQTLIVSRVMTLVVGVITIALAIKPPELIFVLLVAAVGLSGASFIPSFLGGLWWKRGTKMGAIFSIASGLLASIYFWKINPSLGTMLGGHFFVPSVAISTVLYIVVSLLTEPPEKEFVSSVFEEVESKKLTSKSEVS